MSMLWDDSALLTAFNNAINKYKTMHGKQNCGNLSDKGKDISNDTEYVPAVGDESHEEERPVEEVDNGNFEFISSMNAGEANDPPSFEDNHQTNSGVSETSVRTTNVPHLQEAQNVYISSEGVDKHNHINQLLKQYSELEAQRQNMLEQLYQVGYWNNCSCPGEDYSSYAQWGTYPFNTQGYQDPKHQAYNPAAFCSCYPDACHYSAAPCPSMLGCPCCGSRDSKMSKDSTAVPSTKGVGKISPPEDEGVVKTAMNAAEKAISSMKEKVSSPSNLNEDTLREEKELSGLLEGEMAKSINSPTDLSVVLNAWYSAGFYTSKYLLEQSMQKDGKDKSSP